MYQISNKVSNHLSIVSHIIKNGENITVRGRNVKLMIINGGANCLKFAKFVSLNIGHYKGYVKSMLNNVMWL